MTNEHASGLVQHQINEQGEWMDGWMDG